MQIGGHHGHHHVPHHGHGAKPFYTKPVVRLAAGAVVAFMLIVVLLRPSAHDPNWAKHAGIEGKVATEKVLFSDDGNAYDVRVPRHHEDKSIHIVGDHDGHGLPAKRGMQALVGGGDAAVDVAKLANKKRPVLRPVVNGTDYFADYDIHSIQLSPDPPLEPGQKPYFNYIDPNTNTDFAMVYVSNEPRVLMIQDFLSPEECDMIVDMAQKKLFRSQVAPTLGSKAERVQEVRTSSQAWLPAQSKEIAPIVNRMIKLAGFPPGSSEELQVLRYEHGQKYDAHNDYFDPKMYGAQTTNRAVTVFLYLTDVEEGGETQFPRADGKPPTWDFTSCSRGLRVRPRKGQAALFYDMKPNGELDPFSLHGGCPVKKGIKWGGTLWLRVPTGGK